MPRAASTLTLPAKEFVISPDGEELLRTRPRLGEMVLRYCQTTDSPEYCLGQGQDTFVGEGQYSMVRRVDDVALKASTETTGRLAYRYGSTTPENLIQQFTVLSALREHLGDGSRTGVTVPRQYFALRTRSGAELLAQEHMEGWISLRAWLTRHYASDELAIQASVKRRLLDAIASTGIRGALKHSLNDLGLGRRELLNMGNILLRADATDPATALLCIIDQPQQRGSVSSLRGLLPRLQRAA